MKIKLNTQHKSLHSFESEELNDFTIITGKNGSGKTQLLELIENGINNTLPYNSHFSITPKITKIQNGGIIKDIDSSTIDIDSRKDIIKNQLVPFLGSIRMGSHRLINYILDNDINIDELLINNNDNQFAWHGYEYLDIITAEARNDMIVGFSPINPPFPESLNTVNHYNGLRPVDEAQVLRNVLIDKKNQINAIRQIMKNHNKKFNELTESDLFTTPISNLELTSDDFFNSKIESTFYEYADNRNKNNMLFFWKERYKRLNNSVDNDEYEKLNPPPWEIINKIFNKNNIDFYVKGIQKEDFPGLTNYNLKLYKKNDDKTEIPFSSLSSGEKMIIGLVVKLFMNDYHNQNLQFPELILLDEPDAHLHPEMAKLLIDVLNDTFVEKLGIKVIMTTHSPTTIALAPEDSIYELKNGVDTSFRKVTKDYALNLLTEFIPTLSINYKSHRQVFVEAPNDKYYFEKIYNTHFLGKKTIHKLYFVAPDKKEGGCAFVRRIVQNLRKSEVSSTWGIIDWDLKNKSTSNILVHGKNERYSLESYLFDPLLLVALLIKDNIMNFRTELNLNELYDTTKFSLESEDNLQRFSNHFFSKIYNMPIFKQLDNGKMKKVKYLSGQTLAIPKWYLDMQGHHVLIPKLQSVFVAFFDKYNINQIEKKLTDIICNNYYPFIPQSTIDLLEKLANNE